MSIAGQVWTFDGPLPNDKYYIAEDKGRVLNRNIQKYEYSYLLICLNDGKKIDYVTGEPIHEHDKWRRIA